MSNYSLIISLLLLIYDNKFKTTRLSYMNHSMQNKPIITETQTRYIKKRRQSYIGIK